MSDCTSAATRLLFADPPENLLAVNRHLAGRDDTQSRLAPVDSYDGDGHVLTDTDRFVNSTSKYQHRAPSEEMPPGNPGGERRACHSTPLQRCSAVLVRRLRASTQLHDGYVESVVDSAEMSDADAKGQDLCKSGLQILL